MRRERITVNDEGVCGEGGQMYSETLSVRADSPVPAEGGGTRERGGRQASHPEKVQTSMSII